MLKLMYITNDPQVAKIAAEVGVDRIFIDMEVLGKAERQKNQDSVKSNHTPQDIRRIRDAIGTKAEILARVNPLNPNSKNEIDACVENGADLIMLPMWKTADDLKIFASMVNGRAKTMPLLETREADEALCDALPCEGIDEMLIGLNDLHLSYHRTFMFELLADGTVERLCKQIGKSAIPFGFGGVGRPGTGILPADYIIGEHYRLGSGCVILSRSFCNTAIIHDMQQIKELFKQSVGDLRRKEEEVALWTPEQFEENRRRVCTCVKRTVSMMEKR